MIQRQRWNVAGAAPDLREEALADRDSLFDVRIVRNHAARHGQRRFECADGRDVGARQLVGDAVSIGVDAGAEPFRRLHAVVQIELRVGDLAQRHRRAGVVPRPQHEARLVAGTRRDDAGPGQTLDAADVPGAVGATRERPERDAFR